MNITTQQRGKTLVAVIEGRVEGANSRQLHTHIKDIIKPDQQALLLDLGECTYISSAGLRVMLLLARACKQQGSKLVACSMSESVGEVFSVSGFDKLIQSYPTRDEALANLGD